MRTSLALLFALLVASSGVRADEPPPPPTCADDPVFAVLDFWLGDWEVYVNDTLAGHNHIAKILDGCAVTEDWVSVDGKRGHSLFYYVPVEQSWRQVWVTGRAMFPGGVKEKSLVERTENAVRFQGEIRKNSGSYLDRTTLTAMESGEVRQLIEISTDDGSTWKAVFDGRYVRSK